MWTQPPYNDKNSLLFLIPKNLNSLNYQVILILEWIPALFSTFSTTTEVKPLSKAPNPQLFLGRSSNMAAHCSGGARVRTWMG